MTKRNIVITGDLTLRAVVKYVAPDGATAADVDAWLMKKKKAILDSLAPIVAPGPLTIDYLITVSSSDGIYLSDDWDVVEDEK